MYASTAELIWQSAHRVGNGAVHPMGSNTSDEIVLFGKLAVGGHKSVLILLDPAPREIR